MALNVRTLDESERDEIKRGLRSPDGGWSRCCQILRASSQGQRVRRIAANLNWHEESVRRVLRRFNRDGLDGLRPQPRPGRLGLERLLTDEALTAALELARQSPQLFGLTQPVWTSKALANVAYQRELLSFPVTGKRLRRMLERQGYSWKSVKAWLISPDPRYEEKRRASNG
ncbi:MAG: helix-turn-helix domain-containing protein [Candidatus Poribacteria bacterium]|nr:helix-turn-helix domain-containing protein [Candidatus Poribacteria bacterium]